MTEKPPQLKQQCDRCGKPAAIVISERDYVTTVCCPYCGRVRVDPYRERRVTT